MKPHDDDDVGGGSPDDPHGELGVARDASESEIKGAWRRLAARWHPDRNPHPRAPERMKRINEAYRQLVGGTVPPVAETEMPEPPARPRRPWWEREWGPTRWEADGAVAPVAIGVELPLALEDAAFGCRRAVKGSVADLCGACAGTGRLVSHRTDCTTCDGEGRVRSADDSRWLVCPACSGDGAARRACDSCSGSGRSPTARSWHFDVDLPGGLRDGHLVLLRGQGQRSPGGGRGDIELRIRTEPHPLFTFDAEGRLAVRMPVDSYAVAGEGRADVPLLAGGSVAIELVRGTVQVLDSLGYPNRDGSRGPLVVQMYGVTPRLHTERQRGLLRELAADLRANGYAECDELAAWNERVRRKGGGEAAAAAGRG